MRLRYTWSKLVAFGETHYWGETQYVLALAQALTKEHYLVYDEVKDKPLKVIMSTLARCFLSSGTYFDHMHSIETFAREENESILCAMTRLELLHNKVSLESSPTTMTSRQTRT